MYLSLSHKQEPNYYNDERLAGYIFKVDLSIFISYEGFYEFFTKL